MSRVKVLVHGNIMLNDFGETCVNIRIVRDIMSVTFYCYYLVT